MGKEVSNKLKIFTVDDFSLQVYIIIEPFRLEKNIKVIEYNL